MCETIRINGVDVPVDSLDNGLSSEEMRLAHRRHREARGISVHSEPSHCAQGSGSKFVGTPRLQKHKGGRVLGVRVK